MLSTLIVSVIVYTIVAIIILISDIVSDITVYDEVRLKTALINSISWPVNFLLAISTPFRCTWKWK